MTSWRAAATTTVACTLAVAGCSFSGDVQGSAAPGPSTTTTRSPAAPDPSSAPPSDAAADPADPAGDPADQPTAAPGRAPGAAVATVPGSAPPVGEGAGASRPATTAGAGGAPVRCATQDLAVSIGGPTGGAEGTTVVTVVMENTGPAACTLLGYPDVSAVAGSQGQRVGTAAFLSDETGVPTRVTLQPGGAAHASLGLEELQGIPEETCWPVAVDGYRVYPPGSSAAAFVPRTGTTCSAPGASGPSVTPVVPGRSEP